MRLKVEIYDIVLEICSSGTEGIIFPGKSVNPSIEWNSKYLQHVAAIDVSNIVSSFKVVLNEFTIHLYVALLDLLCSGVS